MFLAVFTFKEFMQPHQQRVIDEYDDLKDKTTKLNQFFQTPIFAKLDELEKDRLNRQWKTMQQYGAILAERIDAFSRIY